MGASDSWLPPPRLTESQLADLPDMQARMRKAMRPATADEIGAELMKLAAVLRVPDDRGVDVMAAVYLDDLADIPADIFAQVCKAWRRTEKFWPTIAELREKAEPKLRRRRALQQRVLMLAEVARTPAEDGVVRFEWLSDLRRRAYSQVAVRA